jgi:hypothetical protein
MNRANLPRVFGELMYLFEYREKPVDPRYAYTRPDAKTRRIMKIIVGTSPSSLTRRG